MQQISDYYSNNYSTARKKFHRFSTSIGATLYQLPLDIEAPDNQHLTIDIAWIGSLKPRNVLIHSSGLHGVEGFAGSAIQLRILELLPKFNKDTALVLVHILNPYGMAWLRRVNESNVDLNRNFFSESIYSGTPKIYKELYNFINPSKIKGLKLFYIRAGLNVAKYGFNPLKQAIVHGQYEYPNGLFFGGKDLQLSLKLYNKWLNEKLSITEYILAIDVHTGLGRWREESLFLERNVTEFVKLSDTLNRRLIRDDQESIGYQIRGGHASIYDNLSGQPKVDFITQEFGSFPALKVLKALQKENYFYQYKKVNIDHPSKLELKEVFCPSSLEWKKNILNDGVSLVHQAVKFICKRMA